MSSAQALNSTAARAPHLRHMADTADTSQDAAFSRSTGLPPVLGKADETIKGKVPEIIKLDFMQLAASLGMTESDLLRDIVMVRLYGVDGVQRMLSNKIRQSAGLGPENAQIQQVTP
jgi:hypothetical protein